MLNQINSVIPYPIVGVSNGNAMEYKTIEKYSLELKLDDAYGGRKHRGTMLWQIACKF
jgi:hypothetical protein